jgi:hypothetical protein
MACTHSALAGGAWGSQPALFALGSPVADASPACVSCCAQSFLKLQPQGTINESTVRFLSPEEDVASNSGIYTFDIVKDGQKQQVQARYSFIYKKVNGAWKIAEHHVRDALTHP